MREDWQWETQKGQQQKNKGGILITIYCLYVLGYGQIRHDK